MSAGPPDVLVTLAGSVLFRGLPDAILARAAAGASVETRSLGQVVIKEGEPARGLFLIHSGRARVVGTSAGGQSLTLGSLGAGDGFGEYSCLSGQPAAATVRASGPLVLCVVPVSLARELAAESQEFRVRSAEYVERVHEYNFLRRLNLFEALTADETRDVVARIERMRLAASEILFRQGDAPDSAYIVQSGALRVEKEMAHGPVTVARLDAGDLVGEIALLENGPRTATVTAVSATTLLRLPRDCFDAIVARPGVRAGLATRTSHILLRDQALLAEAADESAGPADDALGEPTTGPAALESRDGYVSASGPGLAGLACLATVRAHYGQWTDADARAAEQVAGSASASAAADWTALSRLAEQAGLLSRLLNVDPPRLGLVPLPAIAERVGRSPVVLLEVTRGQVRFADPLCGIETLPLDRYAAAATGRVLALSYVPSLAGSGFFAVGLLRRFLPMTRPYRGFFAWIVLATAATQALALAAPLFSKLIVDDVLVHGDRSLLLAMVVGMGLATVFQVASSTLSQLLSAYALKRLGVSVALRFFDHLFALPYSRSSRWRSGDLLQRFSHNEKLLGFLTQSGFKVVVDVMSTVVYLAALAWLSGSLTGVALVFAAAYFALLLYAGPRLRAAEAAVLEGRRDADSFLIELVAGIETVKGLARERLFLERGVDLVRRSHAATFRRARLAFEVDLLSELIDHASALAVLAAGSLVALGIAGLRGSVTTGDLVAFQAALGLALAPLRGLAGVWDELQEMRVCYERVADVLSLPRETREGTATEVATLQGHVRLDEVGFRYGQDGPDVLSGVSVDVPAGHKLAIVGRSGSGKTTLVNLLVRLLEPTAGRIHFDGVDAAQLDPSRLRRLLGVVEQSTYVFSGTIRDNIAKAEPDASLERVAAAATLAGAREFIDRLPRRYDTHVGERGVTLSGGQRQRLAIARAILTDPRILILDEATAALDTESELLIQKNLDELMAGRTVIVIAHRLSTVRNADTILVLDRGRVVEQGRHDDLLAQGGHYASLYSGVGRAAVELPA